MQNIRLVLLLLPVFLVSFGASAQIVEQLDPLRPANTTPVKADTTKVKERPDSVRRDMALPVKPVVDSNKVYIIRYRFTADGTITSGNVSRTLLQLTSAVDYSLGNYFKLSSSPSFVYGKQSGILAEREFFGDLRTTYRPLKRMYYLAFGSIERSNLRQINYRWTVAAGAGFKLLNRKRAYISITDVILHENTDFVELNDINIYRNSLRIYGEYTFDYDRWTVTHTAFYQPALGQYNVRWNASLSIQIKLTSVVSVRTTLANVYESLVVPGRLNDDLRFTIGLVYEKK